MTKQTPFQKFEALAQQLVEGSFNRIFSGYPSLSDVATELARVVEGSATAGEVPVQYTIRLHNSAFEALVAAEPNVVEKLTQYLVDFVQQTELITSRSPHITIVADPAIKEKDIVIEPVIEERPSDQTVTQIRHQEEGASLFEAEIVALDAYLIVDGQRHVPLTKPVTNLGRSTENDVVLDAPSVSRKHAQIRWRYGRFILYDVSSRGRTKVNGQPVTETALRSGDVIALSNTLLIYGEGESQPRPHPRSTNKLIDETQIRPPEPK